MLIGIGSGQTSRVDAARQAVEKARAILGPERLAGAACASDAFFPFPDAVEACLAAGVTRVRPAGRLRPRRRGHRRRGRGRRDDARHRGPATSGTEGRALDVRSGRRPEARPDRSGRAAWGGRPEASSVLQLTAIVTSAPILAASAAVAPSGARRRPATWRLRRCSALSLRPSGEYRVLNFCALGKCADHVAVQAIRGRSRTRPRRERLARWPRRRRWSRSGHGAIRPRHLGDLRRRTSRSPRPPRPRAPRGARSNLRARRASSVIAARSSSTRPPRSGPVRPLPAVHRRPPAGRGKRARSAGRGQSPTPRPGPAIPPGRRRCPAARPCRARPATIGRPCPTASTSPPRSPTRTTGPASTPSTR